MCVVGQQKNYLLWNDCKFKEDLVKHIEELKFQGYACFQSEQHLEALADLNFIIGPNNSGKTRFLYLLSTYLRGKYRDGNDDFALGSKDMKWSFRVDGKTFTNRARKAGDFEEIYKDFSWFVENQARTTHNQSTFLPRVALQPNIIQVFQKRHIEDGFVNEASLDGKGLILVLDLWKKKRGDAEKLLQDTLDIMKQYSDKCFNVPVFEQLMTELKSGNKLSRSIVSKVSQAWSDIFSEMFRNKDLICIVDFLRSVSPWLQYDFRSRVSRVWDTTFREVMKENPNLEEKEKRTLLKKLGSLRFVNDWRGISYDFTSTVLFKIALGIWHSRREDKAKKLSNFLCNISDVNDYEIRIYHPNQPSQTHFTLQVRKEIIVKDNDKRQEYFDLSRVGAGVQEAIMLATYALMYENAIICIEEPELHMHPRMQQEFVEFLLNETPNNQYFIATHSAQLINTIHDPDIREKIEIYRILTNNEGWSNMDHVSDKAEGHYELFRTLELMGYRASDLLQVPIILFVEGQSDAIYIREWIRLMDSRLKAGLHYEFMAYGGRSFVHLSGSEIDSSDEEQVINKLIEIPKIVRNFVVVFDSDLDSDSSTDPMYLKKTHFRDNVNDNRNGFVWITDGREIENYVPPQFITGFLDTKYKNLEEKAENWVTPRSMNLTNENCRFIDYFNVSRAGTEEKHKISVSKTKMAEWIVKEQGLDLDMPGLREKIEVIVKLIQAANGM